MEIYTSTNGDEPIKLIQTRVVMEYEPIELTQTRVVMEYEPL